MTSQEISILLKTTREKKKITKTKMADDTGLTRSQILDIENGNYNYTRDTFLKCLKYLDLRISIVENSSQVIV